MPKYAVLFTYKLASGLVIEAANRDEAAQRAVDFEAEAREAIEDAGPVTIANREWGDGNIALQEVRSLDEGEDLIDEWLDEEFGEDDDDFDDDLDDDDDFDDLDDDLLDDEDDEEDDDEDEDEDEDDDEDEVDD